MAGHIEFEFGSRNQAARMSVTQQPFELLVLGDFSRQGRKQLKAASDRQVLSLDLDSVDALWSQFAPLARLELGSVVAEIRPRDIEDFHPDRLFRQLPLFTGMRALRSRLQDPETARAALEELLDAGTESAAEHPVAPGNAEETAETHEDLFGRLLGRQPDARSRHRDPQVETSVDAFVRSVVAPHVVRRRDSRADAAVESVDRGAAELMRRILHHSDLQRLEASWRALIGLVSELELDENLRLHVCDVSRRELLAGLPEPGQSLQDSDLFQLLVEPRRQGGDASPWSVIVGDFYFGDGAEDSALLMALGAAAAANGAVFLGAATPGLLGCESPAQLADARYWTSGREPAAHWQALRRSAIAAHIGLALPRLLGRIPYGGGGEPVESFEFEEMTERVHQHYLWLNPAYACARLLAQSFTRNGWRMQPGQHVDLGFLPAHSFEEDGETRLQPCAEVLLSESTMVAMLDQGLMPLVSYRNQNTAVLGRFQSISDPARDLAGPWQRSQQVP